MGYFSPKNTFLKLKIHIQRIYLTLLTTLCVKIHQIPNVIFENISHFFTTQVLCNFFSSKIAYFLHKWSIKVQIFRVSTARVKIHQLLHVIIQTKGSFSSKFGSLFSVMRDTSSVLFEQLKLYMLLKNITHHSANFQTCYCSH